MNLLNSKSRTFLYKNWLTSNMDERKKSIKLHSTQYVEIHGSKIGVVFCKKQIVIRVSNEITHLFQFH